VHPTPHTIFFVYDMSLMRLLLYLFELQTLNIFCLNCLNIGLQGQQIIENIADSIIRYINITFEVVWCRIPYVFASQQSTHVRPRLEYWQQYTMSGLSDERGHVISFSTLQFFPVQFMLLDSSSCCRSILQVVTLLFVRVML